MSGAWNYRSLSQLSLTANSLSHALPRDIALIVGVPTSGTLAAALVANIRRVPYVDLSSYLAGVESWAGQRRIGGTDNGVVVVIDDSVNSGSELRRVRQAIGRAQEDKVVESRRHIYAAAYATERGVGQVDLFGEVVGLPRVFEWNLMHHENALASTLMDIDGVLCRDPNRKENDDGRRYRKFISSVELQYRPAYRVSALVTSRLEKYRADTEAWLERNHIDYDELIMLDLPSALERRRRRAHALHKATVFNERNETIFIESSVEQAALIHEFSKKQVYCTDNHVFYGALAQPLGLTRSIVRKGRSAWANLRSLR